MLSDPEFHEKGVGIFFFIFSRNELVGRAFQAQKTAKQTFVFISELEKSCT